MIIENIIVFCLISIVLYSAKDKRAIGLLVFCYYAVYILIELDFFGFTTGDLFTTHNEFMIWYLMYTAISFIFFLVSICIYLYGGGKTAIIYTIWIVFNMMISGTSAIFQSFESNSFLFVYNVIQNINLFVDILVVIIGTDNIIRNTKLVTGIINNISIRVDRHFCLHDINSTKDKQCQPTI